LVTGDSLYREYNELNQLVAVKGGNLSTGDILEKFTYHPTEERILIKDIFENGVFNYSVYYVSDEFIRIENSSGNFTEKYIYQNGILVAQNLNGQKQSLHPDHLGSSDLILDSEGNVLSNNFFSPFGEQLEFGNSRFGYEGKEFDEKTQDTDFHFRKYRPNWGRFTKPDTIIGNAYEPQSLNAYSFEENNPFSYIDPSGHILGIPNLPSPSEILKEIAERVKETLEKIKRFGRGAAGNVVNWFGGGEIQNIIDYGGAEYSYWSGDSSISRGDVNSLGGQALGSAGVLVIDRFTGKGGTLLKTSGKQLIETGQVTVKSFKEANFLRKNLFPNAVKVPGTGTSKNINNKNLNKLNVKDGPGTYRNEFEIDPNTGLIKGHGPNNPHGSLQHINIQQGKNKYTILINKDLAK